MGCDLIQGYYFSKPLPVCEAKALFLANDGRLLPAAEAAT
jgi:EAL domain-containing protein (putative c-di-GMP-specific phosphodiesterase class I)